MIVTKFSYGFLKWHFPFHIQYECLEYINFSVNDDDDESML